jgi:hypothetical protein
MPYYHSVFLHGDNVRIFPLEVLQSLLVSYKALSRRLPSNPTSFVGAVGKVIDPYFDHGGHVLYSIEGIPGSWPEDALVDTMLDDPMWAGYPDMVGYYTISIRAVGELSYVVLTDKMGTECLVKFSDSATRLAENMRIAAKRRHFVGFHNRYELEWVRYDAADFGQSPECHDDKPNCR